MRTIKTFLLVSIPLFLISACSGAEEHDDSSQENNLDTNHETDSIALDTGTTLNYLDAYAFLDGPDEYFYMVPPEQDGEEVVELYGVEELHIMPYTEYAEDKDGVFEFMIGIADVGFKMNSPYDEYSGKVLVFYDAQKTVLASEFEVNNGKPKGTCTLLEPNGDVFIERVYSANGDFETSNKEPYCAMWKLDQPNSNLIIDDKQHGFSAEGSSQVVSIMPTNYKDPDYKSTLYQVMAKETFKDQFKINGDVYTGILRGYLHPNSLDDRLYFDLPFRNGWLHGDIKIYDDWGGLYLHEIFVDGELDSTVFQMEYGDGVAKPIIYLYPEKDMLVNVDLQFDGELTHTYPKYNNGWQVWANTEGTLYDESGKEYYALYWEGDNRRGFTVDEGFVVPGANTAEFLEKSLAAVGLNRREANEFIVYWLPLMENNPYNLIHFSTSEYEEMAKLNISPKPETIIRVMMVYKPLEGPIEFPQQDLSKMKVERKGFTVVEWGGSKMKNPQIQ